MVAKCMWFLMFDDWLPDNDAKTLALWKKYAAFFVFPRVAHRMLCDMPAKKIKQLRIDTVNMVKRYGLEEKFKNMNKRLGGYKRQGAAKLCDEIMYVICFAGIGGTSDAAYSSGQFVQGKKPSDSAKDYINFNKFPTKEKMVHAYKANPKAYIKEVCRLNPPVTSATSVLREKITVDLGTKKVTLPEGTLRQYCLSLANRDPKVFKSPEIFDPYRDNLDQALTWNGAFGPSHAQEEKDYPRICPGRHLAIEVVQAIVDLATEKEPVWA